MNFKRNYKALQTTTDNRTFKLAHFAHQGLCCQACINRYRRGDYGKTVTKTKTWIKIPNWKLVSKNKKQWMGKPIQKKTTYRHDREYTDFSW